MAFDRTERFGKLITSTPACLGPGTYDVSEPSKPCRDLDKAYPFLSGASRQTLDIPKDAHKLPGPASYNIQEPRKRILERGGVSIDYTDVRFKEYVHEGVDPARYTLPDDLFKKSPRKIKSHPGTWRGPAGKLWLIRPPRSIMQSGPAILPIRDMSEYDYDEYGILVKKPIIRPKPTYFYNIPRGEANFVTLRYKGNFWSRMKGRDDRICKVTPGPGHYEHETKKTPTQMYNERFREAKRADSKQLRLLDALCRQTLRQNFPAPNRYGLPKSVFDKYKRISCECDDSLVPPPFNQTTERFEDFPTISPGPAAYDVPIPQTCYGSIRNAPFGFCSSRFKKPVISMIPAPGHYHTSIGTLAFESARRFQRRDGYKRKIPLRFHTPPTLMHDVRADDECALTDERKIIDEDKRPIHHAVFKSKVDRFGTTYKIVNGPDPGTYEALSALKANRDRCDFLCRRVAPAFGSRTIRSLKYPKSVDFPVPGPANYDLRGDISKNVKNGVIAYAPREPKVDVKAPGPAHYHIHPYLTSSVVKKPFNVTLGKPKTVKTTCKPVKTTCKVKYYRRAKKTYCCK